MVTENQEDKRYMVKVEIVGLEHNDRIYGSQIVVDRAASRDFIYLMSDFIQSIVSENQEDEE